MVEWLCIDSGRRTTRLGEDRRVTEDDTRAKTPPGETLWSVKDGDTETLSAYAMIPAWQRR